MYNRICPPNSTQHVVKNNDTLWKLSQAYGVSVQNLIDANPGIDANKLQIGTSLCIPAVLIPSTSHHTCPGSAISYIVQAGDTLWKLSQLYGISVQSIIDLNLGIDPQNLQIGSAICIPTAPTVSTVPPVLAPPTPKAPLSKTVPLPKMNLPITCPKGAFSHTIQAGDTFWKLSQLYGISVQSIIDLNPSINPQNLQIGSTICIPTAPPVSVPPTPKAPMTTESSLRNFTYLVKRCDTICGIARKFYVSVESILRENPSLNPKCLHVGMCIYVPINCCMGNTWRYTVRQGDTLNRIANKLNICPSALIAANPNIDFKHLVHCQIICIPKD